MIETSTVIIGASAAGLACAAQLKKRKVPFELLEKEDRVGQSWINHYDRLRLHTNKGSSKLPFVSFPKRTPKYPTKQMVVEYLQNYCQKMDLRPRFNQKVVKVDRQEDSWVVETNDQKFRSKNIIFASGNAHQAKTYSPEGIESFTGPIIHSADYKNGTAFKGKKVLVVGFGNSACEIALDLHEHEASTSISVRSPVNVLPKEILGIPVLQIGIWQSSLPAKLADFLNKPILDIVIGNIEKYGLKKLPYGAIEQIKKHHQIPLLDFGTMSLIKNGDVKVFPGVERVDGSKITFTNGESGSFDAIIAGIGYDHGLSKYIDLTEARLNDLQQFIKKQKFFGDDNLYFCGYYVSPTGMLREMTIESKYIAEDILSRT